ncbi:MAG: hypothetical protein ACLRIQ_13900, partial [Blautia wexlerae]
PHVRWCERSAAKAVSYSIDYRKMPVNSVNTVFQGVLSNDKSVICLPRQCLMDAVKALILLDFLGINQ